MTAPRAAPATLLAEAAHAKVNLSLTVLGRRPDGYHELDSIVAFAAVGDQLTLDVSQPLDVELTGPQSHTLGTAENLVLRAVQRAHAVDASLRAGRFRLAKHLPVAAGLGGGSADAAAALRLLAAANPGRAAAIDWLAIAASIGADVPVCLASRAARMQGLGEQITPIAMLPSCWIVLANPGVPLATPAVFRELAASPLSPVTLPSPALPAFAGLDALLGYLQGHANDLEPAAGRLCPPIPRVLEALRRQPGQRLARMSGSGPTCFALFAGETEAAAAAAALSAAEPGWWVRHAALS